MKEQIDDRRVFLGLEQPPLLSAVDWLVDAHQTNGEYLNSLDLSELVIVVPTRRSGQRLLQILVDRAESSGLSLTPPAITTLGKFPEFLYVVEKELANDLTQQIAWSLALDQSSPEALENLTGRSENKKKQLQDWLPLATLISNLHTRLANDIWSFNSVAREVKKQKGFLQLESQRWDVLNDLQTRYYEILDEAELWDTQAARNFAAAGLLKANEVRCSTDKQIVMLTTADLNRSVSQMLRQIVHHDPAQVNILVAAPQQWNSRFDEYGSLIAEQWLESDIQLSDQQLWIVDQPDDQADAVCRYISQLDFPFAADEITVGVPDESLIPSLERNFDSLGVAHRNLAGKPVSESVPILLLNACRDYLNSSSYSDFSSLVRHPDINDWLVDQVGSHDWLGSLTVFQNNHLPREIRIDENLPFGDPEAIRSAFEPDDTSSKSRAERLATQTDCLNRIHASIGKLLKPFEGVERPVADWKSDWLSLLTTVYGTRDLDSQNSSDDQIIVACQTVADAFTEQQMVPDSFQFKSTATHALDLALGNAAGQRIVSAADSAAVEFAGWLDLALDDAPVMILTGMNDEHVPSSENGHQFLPNELCKKLGIADNERRFARDRYALSVMTSVRKHLKLISGRHNADGEPLKPSRLLFATDHQTAARRAKAFFSYKGKPESRFWLQPESTTADQQQFKPPQPIDPSPVNKLSVTKFRSYLKCPYRFYLQHILRLETVDDDSRELDAGKFGDLVHAVLEAFGLCDCRDSTNADTILEFLNEQLNQEIDNRFQGRKLPALRIQIEQIRQRLHRFADLQADRRRQGWRIVSTEEMLEHEFIVDGDPFTIRGKIDRVDQHEITNQVAVWDYKSSDAGKPPGEVHYAPKKKEWKDLQLPLYRHLVKEVSAVAGSDFSNMVLGYVLLPKNLDDVGFVEAEWDAATLESADDVAKSIIRQLRNAVFWPPTEQPPEYSEDFAPICLDNVFENNVGGLEPSQEAVR